MANDNFMKILVAGILIWVLFGQGTLGPQTTGGTGGTGTAPATTNCNYAPTAQLQSVDKWDTSRPSPNQFTYILNGGSKQTDSDGSFEVTFGDDLSVLWGQANKSSYYRDIGTYTIDKCGLNTIQSNNALESGQTGLIANTSITLQCFNEEGNLIDTSGENETIGTGDSVSLACEIRGTSEKGFPHGGVIVAEMNKTAYDEGKFALTGEAISGDGVVPNSHSIRAATDSEKAFNVIPQIGPGVIRFTASIQAETDKDPDEKEAIGNNAADITLSLYANDAYYDTETGKFAIGVEDQDNVLTKGGSVGEFIIQVD